MTDTERLDWLEGKKEGCGEGWVCRRSTNGRGFRVHETSSWKSAMPTVREAIDFAMTAEEATE